MKDAQFLMNAHRIFAAARANADDARCAVSMAPEARERLKTAIESMRSTEGMPMALSLRAAEPRALGLNDGVIIPPDSFPLGTSPSVIRSAAADRAPLRGTLRVIVVLVDFSDKHMAQTQQHFRDLFFKQNGPQKSVRDYYAEVTNGLIDIQGDVVGPFRMPQTLAAYAHGASGMGSTLPNAQTMAHDAAVAANPTVNFTPYDNDGNGFVDAFIVIHAGTGAETNANPGDIWSHKWTLAGGQMAVDSTKIFGYLTVPEDCKIGVCAHELGHLLFGFPDLYDTDNSSEGIGDWCLMASGSWGGGGAAPCHPSAWCKVNQGWVTTDVRTTNATVQIADVKTSHLVYRLWKDGGPGKEYFLVENRQKAGAFDSSLPGSGLLIWHIDENQINNRDENHYWVALMQADAKRNLELNQNRGDAGDCWPGSSGNTNFTATSTPNSKSYAGAPTCVAVTGISAAGSTMSATLQVKCSIKVTKEFVKEKEIRKESLADKRIAAEKSIAAEKRPDKTFVETKLSDGKFSDGKFAEGGRPGLPGVPAGGVSIEELAARVAALESAIHTTGISPAGGPFIGSELRPDLSQGALSAEDDGTLTEQMAQGSVSAKRLFDSKPG